MHLADAKRPRRGCLGYLISGNNWGMENGNVLKMPEEDGLTDQDMCDLFMGFLRLVKNHYQAQIDSLREIIAELRG